MPVSLYPAPDASESSGELLLPSVRRRRLLFLLAGMSEPDEALSSFGGSASVFDLFVMLVLGVFLLLGNHRIVE